MSTTGVLQIVLYLAVLLAMAEPLGAYMAAIYQGRTPGAARLLRPIEAAVYRTCRVAPEEEMTWQRYAVSLLAFSLVGFVVLYLIQRLQGSLPLNPQRFPGLSPDLSFNTAISFITNTNWQSYGGETSMSYLTQMLGLGVQNFVSAAAGMAVLAAFIRGLARKTTRTIGNFWADLCRTTIYILLPLAFILAVILVSQGVVQSFAPYKEIKTPEVRVLPLGPAASQVAIKQLGTNGGGFFNANSAHPFENPTPLSNFLELLAILLIPAALCHTFGRMVGDKRQGRTLLAAMMVIFIPLVFTCYHLEQHGGPQPAVTGISQGGNMEGKEVRFGVPGSALWATATTAASNGSVNSMHDSFTPLGGLIPMWLMQIGEVVFGGAGSGLYGMLMFAVMAVVHRRALADGPPVEPWQEFVAFEMTMAARVVRSPPAGACGNCRRADERDALAAGRQSGPHASADASTPLRGGHQHGRPAPACRPIPPFTIGCWAGSWSAPVAGLISDRAAAGSRAATKRVRRPGPGRPAPPLRRILARA